MPLVEVVAEVLHPEADWLIFCKSKTLNETSPVGLVSVYLSHFLHHFHLHYGYFYYEKQRFSKSLYLSERYNKSYATFIMHYLFIP